MKDTTELRVQRHKLIEEARALVDKADGENRLMTAEERGQYDRIMGAVDEKRQQIEDQELRNDLERKELEEKSSQEEERDRRKVDQDEKRVKAEPPKRIQATDEYRTAFEEWLVNGKDSLTNEQRTVLSAGTQTAGGYLYASEQFSNELIQSVTDATIVRNKARVMKIAGADSIGCPTLATRMDDAVWGSELGVPSEDTALAFGKRLMTPHPLALRKPVSKVLLRKATDSLGIVRDEMSRAASELMEKAYMTGSGAQQPLGLFTASSDGISTSRDVSTGNTDTEIRFDGLKAALFELKQQYWPKVSWIFHRDVMEQIAKLKDGNGRYLLQDSVTQGEPLQLLGKPVALSEFAPNTMTASQYVGILGAFEHYWIVDDMNVEIARAQELLILNNQDLFVLRMGSDGAPVLEEAFVRVQLSA